MIRAVALRVFPARPGESGHAALNVLALVVALALAALGAVQLYEVYEEGREVPAVEKPPVTVRVHVVEKERMQEELEATGFLRSSADVVISAEVAARVVEVAVDEGDAVRAGQILVELDASSYRARLEAAEARRAGLDASLNFARKELERTRKLVAQQSSVESELDRLAAEVDRLEASLRESTASIALARQDVERCQVEAPLDGVVLAQPVEPGEFASPGARLLAVRAIDRLELTVHVPAVARLALRTGTSVEVELEDVDPAYHDLAAQRRAEVVRLPAAHDPATRRFPIVLSLDNATRELVPGLFATARIPLPDANDVLTVPRIAVFERFGQRWARVVETDANGTWRVRERAIVVAPIQKRPSQWRVERGLAVGDRVVVQPQEEVRAGSEVIIASRREPSSSPTERQGG